MSQPDTLVLQQSLPRERLDRHLATLLPGVSRATIQRLIIDGRIKVDGILVKPTHLVGGYAQLAFAFNYLGPTGNQRDEVTVIRKRSQEVTY